MNKKKLGLDLGTNSLGWSVLVKQNKKYTFLNKQDSTGDLIPTKGSYIFPKGVSSDENSKAAERRGFRNSRVRLQRIVLRKIATLKVLNKYSLCPSFDEGELNKWKNKKIYPNENEAFIEWQRTGKKNGNSKTEQLKQPYYLRHLAATKEGLMDFEQGRLQLGRVFYHLAQRRGYLSNSEEEQTEDKLELFKTEVIKLLEEVSNSVEFKAPFEVLLKSRNSDKKVKSLGAKINRTLKKEISFDKIKDFIIAEFNKPENLGKVMKAIGELSKEIKTAFNNGKCAPTMGSYFYSVYATTNKKTGLITKIRGRYTHREEHYLQEFNFICDKQNITGKLRSELHNAIFYQRPLRSQKGLVAKCPLEPKRKRIAISHPLFEEFRMWESINRIKISRSENAKLEFLTKEEKEIIKPLFLRVGDFEFSKIAALLSDTKTYCYIKKPKEVFYENDTQKIEGGIAEVFFNFPMDKKFSACPTTAKLTSVLGKKIYNNFSFLNTSYKTEKAKKQVSIEDIWHCLFLDSFEQKDKKQGRKDFAVKHLKLDDASIEAFQKIKLVKGYGNLSKAALKKILPFLRKGELYSHAVFLANISKVLGRKLKEGEQKTISERINLALKKHKEEKKINGTVNNFISELKDKEDNKNAVLGDNQHSIDAFKKGLKNQLITSFGKTSYQKLNEDKKNTFFEICWEKFYEAGLDKTPKNISFIKTKTIPNFILKTLQNVFPNEKIDVTKLYHPSAMEAYPKAHKKLGNPEISSIKNPVFNRSMHQIKRLCNKLILEGIVDKDTIVNIEVAREINSVSYRKALSLWQKDQEIIRDWAKKEIIETYPKECQHEINPSDTDVVKYIFWKEQNYQCLYTAKQISICNFLGGKTIYDIEHTIPRSKFHDNSLTNKTLANADFNRNFKKDTLPGLLNMSYNGEQINKESILRNRNANLKSYSFSGKKPNVSVQWNLSLSSLKAEYKKFKNAAKAISDPISHSEVMTKAHYTKMKLDYLQKKYNTFETEEITQKFSNANLVDTRIISKYARAYLKSYFNNVNVVNGKITDTLRKMWGIEGEYAKKDRSNHIHHCIDATTVACVERGTANWISEAFHKYENDYFKGNNNPRYKLNEPMLNFAEQMHNLHKEVFVYHKQIDRIKPLLENLKKEQPKKLNLRGKLNSQNPYAHIKKNDELIFAKRELVSKLKTNSFDKIIDEGIKARVLSLGDEIFVEDFLKKSIKDGFIELPAYTKEDGKKIKRMIIKKIRLKSSVSKLKDYKEIRTIDKSKFEYKQDFYFDKDSYTNYEARIYGDLIPNEKGKFKSRNYIVINHYNIVKNIFEVEKENASLKLHQDDMFLVFDKNPIEEIKWDDTSDIQKRLFILVKFDENGIIVLKRHNYASGNVDKAKGVKSENDLSISKEVVLRRSPSTLRVIPARLNTLGKLDVMYSKNHLID